MNKQIGPLNVWKYVQNAALFIILKMLFYSFFFQHVIPIVSINRKPVQLPWTGFLNLQMFKPVLTWKPVFPVTTTHAIGGQ